MVQVYEKLALLYPYYFESLRLEDQTPEIQERVRKLRKADADRQALYAQWAAGYSDKD